MSIYTKKGDKGKTSVFDKSSGRVSKSSLRIYAIGSIDEANSFIGLAASFVKDKRVSKDLWDVQRDLFSIGSIIAGAKIKFSEKKVERLEEEIDKMESQLPKLTNFILPGGGEAGAHLHTARTMARRMERELVRYLTKSRSFKTDSRVFLRYVNRLSDYLFMTARYVNRLDRKSEKVWINK